MIMRVIDDGEDPDESAHIPRPTPNGACFIGAGNSRVLNSGRIISFNAAHSGPSTPSSATEIKRATVTQETSTGVFEQ